MRPHIYFVTLCLAAPLGTVRAQEPGVLGVRPPRRVAAATTIPATPPAGARPAHAASATTRRAAAPQPQRTSSSAPAERSRTVAHTAAATVVAARLADHDTVVPAPAPVVQQGAPSATSDSAAGRAVASTAPVAATAPVAPPAPSAPAPAATTPATAATPAATAAPKAPAALVVGTGSVTFSGNLQAWYVGGANDVTSTFRVRRAEMRFVGVIGPRAKWTLMVDPAKSLKVADGKVNQGSMLLQDAFVTLRVGSFDVDAGQVKLPLTYEGGVASSAKLESIERSPFINDGKLGLVRDLGVLASGPLSGRLRLALGVFNGVGDGQNATDANEQKVVVGRLELQTALRGLQLATSGAWGGSERPDNVRHDRVGADAVFARGPLGLRAEWMRAWDAKAERLGGYGLASWRVRDVEVVGRWDYWDRDTRTETASADLRERDWLVGASWFVTGSNVKVQANYQLRTFDRLPREGMVLLNMQTAW
jgi:hypothetical protein